MKRIVAMVSSVSDAEAVKSVTNSEPSAPEIEEVNGVDVPNPSAGAVRMEVVVSDAQAKRFLAILLEHGSANDDGTTLEGLLQKELEMAGPDAVNLFERVVLGVERKLITQVYYDCDQVTTHAAARLGMNRNTLSKKLRQYQLVES